MSNSPISSVPAVTSVPVLYDADCGFCRFCLALVLSWDRRGHLRPVALQGAEADSLLSEMPVPERAQSWHVVIGGEVYSAGDAFPPLLRLLPAGRPLAALAARLRGPTARGYRLVADHRSQLGHLLPRAATRWADRRIRQRGVVPRS